MNTKEDEMKIAVSADTKEDKLDGLYEVYYKDGKLRSRYNYQAGERDGLAEGFYEDGKLSYRCNYKAGERNSKVYTNFETFVRSLSNLEKIQLLREATSVNDKETCKLITEILKQKSDTEKENAGNKTN